MFKNNFPRELALNSMTKIALRTAPVIVKNTPIRHTVIWTAEHISHLFNNKRRPSYDRPPGVIADRAEFSQAILHSIERLFSQGVSPMVSQRLIENLVRGIFIDGGYQEAKEIFFEENQSYPPSFLTLSPGKTCNLHCKGCYASAGPTGEKLDWDIFDRIITEAKTQWGVRFLVISGGEPLAYRSNGKGILDAAEKHPDIFFLMYTNGTLINDSVADRLANLGNLTPAISVEGWRERTDERRGEGVFDKVLAAMTRLRHVGVPFGISITATRSNAEEILSDKFLDFFFEQQGVTYGWIFHYMPIGRSYSLALMPTPEQRVWMWRRMWQIIRERHIFLADFWNSATLSDGCIAGGRAQGGGYLYIDWNGNVSPCVFVPYSPINIKDIYAKGGTLNDVWANPFFAGIRNWQEGYRQNKGNWLAPCIIRDHHSELRKLIAQNEPDPIDEFARQALLDPEYAHGLEEYDKQHQALTKQLWEEQYLSDGKK